MKFLIFIMLTIGLSASEYKVLLDVQTGNAKLLQKNLIDRIAGLQSYYVTQKGDKLRIVVLVSGSTYKFFLKETDKTLYSLNKNFSKIRTELQTKLELLSTVYDVKFETCSMGMQRREIKQEQLVDFVSPIYSHSVGLIDWQSKGYIYLPVH